MANKNSKSSNSILSEFEDISYQSYSSIKPQDSDSDSHQNINFDYTSMTKDESTTFVSSILDLCHPTQATNSSPWFHSSQLRLQVLAQKKYRTPSLATSDSSSTIYKKLSSFKKLSTKLLGYYKVYIVSLIEFQFHIHQAKLSLDLTYHPFQNEF